MGRRKGVTRGAQSTAILPKGTVQPYYVSLYKGSNRLCTLYSSISITVQQNLYHLKKVFNNIST